MIKMTEFVRRGVAAAAGLLVLAGVCGGGCPVAVAGGVNGYSEAYLTRALTVARAEAARSAEQAAATRQAVAVETAELDAETVQAKARLKTLENDLLAASAEANPALLRAVQAEHAAVRARLEAADAWRSLRLKEAEEAGRETEAWTRRAAALELGLNLDMRVLLASPAELEARGRGPAALRKDLEAQAGQIRRLTSRARSAAGQAAVLGRAESAVLAELAAKAGKAAGAGPAAERCERARRQQADQLARARQAQEGWFLLSWRLAERARRNDGFLTEELAIAAAYAAALDMRAGDDVAAAAAARAEAAEALLAQARQALGGRQTAAVNAAAAAGQAAETALAALARAATPEERAAAQARLFLAQEQAAQATAGADLMREAVALHKALAAFARDRADKERAALEPKTLAGLRDEAAALAEAVRTSEEYVASFKAAQDKLEGQVQAARQGLGLAAAAAAPVLALVNEQAPLLVRTQPGRPELLENRLQVLARKLLSEKPAAAGDAERRRALAEGLLARQAQRALLAQRQAVAELWLAANRDAQKTLQAAGARVLWEQRDARLDGRSLTELLAVVPAAWDDLRLAVDAGSLGLMRAAGYATPGQLLTGGLFWMILLAAGIWGTRRLAAADAGGAGGGAAPARWRWLTVRLLPVLPAAAAGGGLLLQALPGNRLALLLGWGLLGLGAWWLCRTLLLAGCPGHRFPPRATLAGGILLAVRLTLGAGILLAVWGGAASGGILAGPRLVLFCLFLLVFWLALVRLALHPLLLGRFLSRRSEHLGLRLFGSLAAGGGILAVMLTVVPFLFTLDNLGRMILQVTVATGLAAALAALLCHACNWLGGLAGPAVPRTEPATAPEPALPAAEETPAAAAGRALLKGLAQTAIAGGATLLILFGWWRLLEMLLLAPDAPPAVRQVAALGAAYGRTALTWWNYPLADRVTVRSLAEGVGVFALFIWLSRVARHVFLRQVLVRTHMDEATRNTLVTVLGYLVVVLGFLVGLNVAGSSLQNLALLAGAITVGLGFGLQNVVNNFVSSLLIHFSRTVRAGDYIDVGGSRGTVREIGFRCTTIVTDDGVTVLVPNGSFIAGNIVNWTNPNPATRLHLPLTVSRGADLAEATRRLTALAAGHALILRQPAPSLEVRAVATGAITVDLLVWTNQPDRQAAILSDLTLACDQELRARNWAAG